jgi:hypothetical protein
LPDGRVSSEGLQRIRAALAETTTSAFQGSQGDQDLELLAVAGLQPHNRPAPAEFRRAAAEASAWEGENAAGRRTPRQLGLDTVAAGAHFAALNRFTKLSEQAGLSGEQRQQLLEAVRQEGQLPAPLRRNLEASLRQRRDNGLAAGLKIDHLIDSARALPDTIEGPLLVRLTRPQRDQEAAWVEAPRFRQADKLPAPVTTGQAAGAGPSDLKQAFKAEAKGKFGRPSPAVFAKPTGNGAGAAGNAGPSAPAGEGRVHLTSPLLEEEKIKKAAPPRRAALPALKELEDEPLAPDVLAGKRQKLKEEPASPGSTQPAARPDPGPKSVQTRKKPIK